MNNNSGKIYLIGVAGGSASGKSYLVKQLKKIFSEDVTLVSQDNYYKNLENQVPDEHGDINFDHPNAVNLELLVAHLKELSQGNAVEIEEYTFNNPNVQAETIVYKPTKIIIIEGLFIMYYKKLQELLDLKIFVEAEDHIRFARRIERDLKKRGKPLEEILHQYRSFVIPMYRRFVEPYKYECDLIIPNQHGIDIALNVLKNYIENILRETVLQ